MKIICDYVLVKIDNEFNKFLGVITDEHGNEHQLLIDTRWRPQQHAKITAEVIAVPGYLSGKESPFYEKYPGMPRPKSYRGHEQIHRQMMMLPKKYQKLADKQIPYSCGGYTAETVTNKGLAVEVIIGDKVYFHYGTLLQEENYMYRDRNDGRIVYKVPYHSIFCRVRNNEIYMLNGNVLVEEFFDEDLESVDVGGNTIRAKIKNNLVTQIGEKPKYLTGVLRYIGMPIGDDTRETCRPGELIMFRPSSEFVNEIEGQEYYVMKQWDIVAKVLRPTEEEEEALTLHPQIVMNNLVPVGDYVLIDPELVETRPFVRKHVFDPNAPHQEFEKGELFVLQSLYSHERKNKNLKFGVGTVISCGENSKDVCGERIAYGKGYCYLYLEEYKVVLIRYGDILGEFINELSDAEQ